MSRNYYISFLNAIAVSLWLSLSGCAIQLAPPYDKAVADGLNSANTEAMTLLVSVSGGSKPETFSNREEKYNSLIGKMEALAIQAGARPMPKNNVTDTVNRLLEKRNSTPLPDDDSTPPSSHAITKIADTFTKMRDTDRKQGLTGFEAQAFKGQVLMYFDQAITYENFLQR